MIPLTWAAAAVAAAFAIGAVAGYSHKAKAVEAERTKAALTASQEEISRAHKTTDILGILLGRPDLASDAVVADRLCERAADSAGMPKPASRPRPSSPGIPSAAGHNQELAAELKQCVRLADEWDTLRAVWKANEATP